MSIIIVMILMNNN